VNKIAINELRRLYGLSDVQGDSVEEAMKVLQFSADANRAYFIVKFDGERTNNKFTAVFNAQNIRDGIIRIDGDSMSQCIDYVLQEILNMKAAGLIQ